MPQPSNLYQMLSDYTPISGEAMQRFKDQPTLENTAASLVADALKRLSPPVELSPWDIALGWPSEASPTGETEHLVMPRLLIELFVAQSSLTIVPGYQLALFRQDDRWVPLNLDLAGFAQELDAVRPSLMHAHWQALSRFWSEADIQGVTHWKWMAGFLRKAYRRELSLALADRRICEDANALALTVANIPPAKLPHAAAPAKAMLVQLERQGKAMPFDVRLDPHLLIALPMSVDRESYVLFSTNAGLRYVPDAAALTAFLDARLAEDGVLEDTRLHVLTPEQDPFVALARTLLQTQLLQMDGVTAWIRDTAGPRAPVWLEWCSDALTGFFQLDGHVQAAQVRRLQSLLPHWLQQASLMERWHYGKGLLRLAVAEIRQGHKWFLDGIPTIEAYALDRLSEVAAKAYPGQEPIVPENIRLTLEHVVPDPTAVAGGPVDASIVREPLELKDLLIDNLAAHPGAWLQVDPKPGATLPGWLNGTALLDLVQQANVGGMYPQVLRQQLQSGPEAPVRRAVFQQQVKLQLPLLAQELTLRQAFDFSAFGAYLVESGVGTDPVAQPGTLMGLGITAGENYGIDRIAATYVFVASEGSGECCVLYRPLHAVPLRQFSSLDALLENLAAPGDLQDEALRWMTDLGRARYSHGGFREPRVARFGQGAEFSPVERTGPARLALVPLATPVLDTLYDEVVAALIHMAERRSVSNSENRWVSLSQLAWTLFNGLLPIFSGPLATAGWLIQLSEVFARFLEAEDKPSSIQDGARRDLLFTVVMLLLSEAIRWPNDDALLPAEETSSPPTVELPEESLPTGPVEKPNGLFGADNIVRVSEVAVPEAEALPIPVSFELDWTSPELSLNAAQRQALSRLRIVKAIGNPSLVPQGPTRGLYLFSDRLLVKVGQDFFKVSLEPEPRIVGLHGEPGPYLRRDEAGRWTLDLRLRLRGGGPKRRIEARRQQNIEIRAAADRLYTRAIEEFDRLIDEVSPLAEEIERRADTGETVVAERERLHQVFEKGYKRCADLWSEYQALQAQTPLPDFAERACGLLARMLSATKAITNNLAELSRGYLLDSPFSRLSGAEMDRHIENDLESWQNFLQHQDDVSERELHYVLEHHNTIVRIEEFPGLGARTLQRHEPSVALLRSSLDLYATLAYCRIGLITEPLRAFPELAQHMQDALEPALIYAESHSNSAYNPAVSDEEKTRIFDTAIGEYQRVEDALELFEQTLEPQFKSAAMPKLREVLAALIRDAEQRMGELVREAMVEPSVQVTGKSKAGKIRPDVKPGRAKPGKGKKGPRVESASSTGADAGRANEQALQVIRTADGQTVMAQVRVDPNTQAQTATVISNNQVVATWHLNPETGLWVKPVRRPAVSSGRAKRLDACIREADRSLAAARNELERIDHLKKVTRVPADLQDQYHGRAAQLDELAEQIDRALTRLNETDAAVDRGSAEVKAHELRNAADRCRTVGTQARIDLSLSLPPTPGRVQFLLEQGRVDIHRLGTRVPLGRTGRRDFVQEYEIRDSGGRPLWYAHFHYDTATAPAEQYTAAHLKTLTQRFDGYQKQLEQAKNDQEVVSIYRSRIEPNLARSLFLSLP